MGEKDKKPNYNEIDLDHEISRANEVDYDIPDTLLEEVIDSKEKVIEKTIDEFTSLIDERINIRAKVLSGLEKEILRAHNVALEGSVDLHYQNIMDDKKRIALEKEISTLEKARIDEYVQAWQDILNLKKEIVQLVNKLFEARIRRKMLEK